jgi:Flp pilus assembly protein TadD
MVVGGLLSRRVDLKIVVAISFATLTLGFLVGSRVGGGSGQALPDANGGAPHAVGVEEYVQLGVQALDQGDPATAERYFRSAVALVPSAPGPRGDLAVSLMAQGRWADADRELTEAQRLGPDRPELYFVEGVMARDGLADTVRARAAWTRFLELAPEGSQDTDIVQQWLSGQGEFRPTQSE